LDDDQDGGWVNVSSGTGSPGKSRTKERKTIVVVVVVVVVSKVTSRSTVAIQLQNNVQV